MKKVWLCLSLLYCCKGFGQINLVPNGGFEFYKTCPTNVGQFDSLVNWYTVLNTPDYFNSCATYSMNPNASVPRNFLGYQYPSSGNGYAGFWVYDSGNPTYREYIGTALISPLLVGQKYYIAFKLNLTLGYNSNLACDKMGLRFTNIKNVFTTQPAFNNTANVYASSIISDSLNWTKIFGSFIADSTYGYIEMGNFFDTPNTNYTTEWSTGGSSQSYYYIDDVCISSDSIFSSQWTASLQAFSEESEFTLIPNPSTGKVSFSINLKEEDKVLIHDSYGNEIKDFKLNINEKSIEFAYSGIYFISIRNYSTLITRKIIINK